MFDRLLSVKCSSCGVRFYTKDASVHQCQHCSGDLPDKTSQAKTELENKLKRTVRNPEPQTFPVNALKQTDGDPGDTVVKTKRKTRKPKGTEDNASTSTD